MEELLLKSNNLIRSTSEGFIRSLYDKIDWESRFVGVVGARGTGKTTMLLQTIKRQYKKMNEAIYISLDDIYFVNHSLISTIEQFRLNGGKVLFIDEVHKYPDWARELKNAYDFYPDIKVVFTGSSIIDIMKEEVDLSRRVVMYELQGLSFREYLEYENVFSFKSIGLDELLQNHQEIATEITKNTSVYSYFVQYLKNGYYPFYKESKKSYEIRLEQVVKMIVESELSFIQGFDIYKTRKILQLLSILGENVPFTPNVSKLSEKIQVHRNVLVEFLHYLEKARLINTLSAEGKSVSKLQKPEKIFLENTNLSLVLSRGNWNIGSARETFALNQLKAVSEVSLPKQGDFFVNQKFTFEIGGKEKTSKQIQHIENGYVFADELEVGVYNKIPLWLLGFLY
jgi:predicted AAA+ superfamily ATPase